MRELSDIIKNIEENTDPHPRTLRNWLLDLSVYIADHRNKIKQLIDPIVITRGTVNADQEKATDPEDQTVKVFKDGNSWCALLGANLQEGVAGFGETASEAINDLGLKLVFTDEDEEELDDDDDAVVESSGPLVYVEDADGISVQYTKPDGTVFSGHGDSIEASIANLNELLNPKNEEPAEVKLPPYFQVFELESGSTRLYYHKDKDTLIEGNGETLDDAVLDLAAAVSKAKYGEEHEETVEESQIAESIHEVTEETEQSTAQADDQGTHD